MATAGQGGLRGRRLLVVGASSGIGRAVAVGAAASGAAIALAARRTQLVEDAAAEAGAAGAPATCALACDATDPEAALALGARAAAALGGLDAVVYAAGISLLSPLSAFSAEQWHEVLRTNVVGASLVVAGALDCLRASVGHSDAPPTVVVLSTHTVGRPWPGLVPYAASKAALDALARGLREEEPWLRVVDVVVGNTVTGFADGWDPVAAADAFERWRVSGYLDATVFSAQEMASVILDAVADPTGPEDVSVVGSGPA